jgi:Predicted oxidoreductases (related to aryl-alcohol dehydrogenases)
MRYRPLGQSGLLVSVVGLGCNNFGGRLDADRTRSVVDAAIDVGITLFDTSDTYGGGGGSERALGEILGSRRDQVVLATKFGGRGVDMGYGPRRGRRAGEPTSAVRWPDRCAGCAPTTSTCTSCTSPTWRPRSRRPSPP